VQAAGYHRKQRKKIILEGAEVLDNQSEIIKVQVKMVVHSYKTKIILDFCMGEK
jgi:hypothetical protein